MSEHVENLRPGDFIVVIGDRDREAHRPTTPFMAIFECERRPLAEDLTGVPLKVLAVEPPFVCITDGETREAIDIRRWQIRKVSRAYVRAMSSSAEEDAKAFQVRGPRPKPDPKACPRCSERLVERMKAGKKPVWVITCRNCGLEVTK